MKKLFAPDLMFNNHIKGVWFTNIQKDDTGNIPVNEELKAKGVYAIQIEPNDEDNNKYWALGFPLNKSWNNESLNSFSRPALYVDIVSSNPINITVNFQSTGGEAPSKIAIDNTEDWKSYKVNIPSSLNKQVKLIVFSGPIADTIILMKNIYIK